MKPRMYYGYKLVDVVFTTPHRDEESILADAEDYLKEEWRTKVFLKPEVKEVTSIDDVPQNWTSALYWGDNANDETVSAFLKRAEDPEYAEYLRLKAKFKE